MRRRLLAAVLSSTLLLPPQGGPGPTYLEAAGRTPGEAVDSLYVKVRELSGLHVSTRSKLLESDGGRTYSEFTVVDAGAVLSPGSVELENRGDRWIARVPVSEVKPVDPVWVEQNVTVNHIYREQPRFTRGYLRDGTVTRTRRIQNIVGPTGRPVKSTPGTGTVTTVKSNWDGRSGYTRTSTRKEK